MIEVGMKVKVVRMRDGVSEEYAGDVGIAKERDESGEFDWVVGFDGADVYFYDDELAPVPTATISGIPVIDEHNSHVAWIGNYAVPGEYAGKQLTVTWEVVE